MERTAIAAPIGEIEKLVGGSLIMFIHLVAYDLHAGEHEQRYNEFADKIRSLGTAAKIQRSVWWLKTSFTEREILEALSSVVDMETERFVVTQVSDNCQLINPMELPEPSLIVEADKRLIPRRTQI